MDEITPVVLPEPSAPETPAVAPDAPAAEPVSEPTVVPAVEPPTTEAPEMDLNIAIQINGVTKIGKVKNIQGREHVEIKENGVTFLVHLDEKGFYTV